MKQRIQKLIDVYTTYVFGLDRDAGWHAPSQLESFQNISNKKAQSKTKHQNNAIKIGLTDQDEDLEVSLFERLETKLTAWFSSSCERSVNDRPDDKMINEMQFVRSKHNDFKLAQMLFSRLEDKQLLSLMAEPYLKYVYKKPFTDAEVAKYLEINKHTYRHTKKVALNKVEGYLVFLDQYKLLRMA